MKTQMREAKHVFNIDFVYFLWLCFTVNLGSKHSAWIQADRGMHLYFFYYYKNSFPTPQFTY